MDHKLLAIYLVIQSGIRLCTLFLTFGKIANVSINFIVLICITYLSKTYEDTVWKLRLFYQAYCILHRIIQRNQPIRESNHHYVTLVSDVTIIIFSILTNSINQQLYFPFKSHFL